MRYLALILLFCFQIFAQSTMHNEIIENLKKIAGTKAIIQWERVFKSEKKMKKYKIDLLTENEKLKLKEYLISHAADSHEPEFAGF